MNDSTIFNELAEKNIKRYWLLNNSEQPSAIKLICANKAWLLFNEIDKDQTILTQP